MEEESSLFVGAACKWANGACFLRLRMSRSTVPRPKLRRWNDKSSPTPKNEFYKMPFFDNGSM